MKNKKLLSLVLAFLTLFTCFSLRYSLIAKAETLDAADMYFVDFIKSDTHPDVNVQFSHTPLYDENLEINGRQYIFSVDNVPGYALMNIKNNGDNELYDITEYNYNKITPFNPCEGLPVYITYDLYMEYKNGAFYNLASNQAVSSQDVEYNAYQGFGYCGAGTFVDKSETVNYSTKQTESYSIQYDLPNYFGSVDGSVCANTAGAVLIGYYDRFYENLIPNFQSYIKFGGIIKYRTATQEVLDVVDELHGLMGGESEHLGVTFPEFQEGMEAYVSNKGYTYTTTNMFSWGSFSLSKYKASVESGKPVALFLSGFEMLNGINENSTNDIINSSYCSGAHVEIGCGYKIDTYYDANGKQIATRTYLKVASGLPTYNIGYLLVDAYGNLDRAISVQIS